MESVEFLALIQAYTGIGIGFFEMRKEDLLQKGTLLHFPIPGKALEAITRRAICSFDGCSYRRASSTNGKGGFESDLFEWLASGSGRESFRPNLPRPKFVSFQLCSCGSEKN